MKNYFIYLLAAVMALGVVAGDALARAKKEKAAPATTVAKKTDPKKVQEQLARKRKDLEGTSWSLTVKGSDPADSHDTIKFQDSRVSSVRFLTLGFAPTNYTLSMGEGVVIVETMQTSEKNGTLFWRGEFAADTATCKGMFSHVLPDKKTEDIYFTGKKITEKPEEK